jgi:membrane protein DedA with SNARE-associated domain
MTTTIRIVFGDNLWQELPMLDTLREYLSWAATLVTDFTLANSEWAPFIIFALALAESLAIVSIFIPSTVILIGLGAVAMIGGLPLVPLIIAAIIGAFLGDWVSYLVGRWFKAPLLRMWPLNGMRDMVGRVEALFQKYGWLTYFFGRFLGPIRAVFPLFAGIMGMPQPVFLAVNALSAIAWASLVLGGGVLLGESFVIVRDWL